MTIASTSSSSATQESRETAAQTAREAAHGDQQAIQKLARQEAAKKAQTVEAPVAKELFDTTA